MSSINSANDLGSTHKVERGFGPPVDVEELPLSLHPRVTCDTLMSAECARGLVPHREASQLVESMSKTAQLTTLEASQHVESMDATVQNPSKSAFVPHLTIDLSFLDQSVEIEQDLLESPPNTPRPTREPVYIRPPVGSGHQAAKYLRKRKYSEVAGAYYYDDEVSSSSDCVSSVVRDLGVAVPATQSVEHRPAAFDCQRHCDIIREDPHVGLDRVYIEAASIFGAFMFYIVLIGFYFDWKRSIFVYSYFDFVAHSMKPGNFPLFFFMSGFVAPFAEEIDRFGVIGIGILFAELIPKIYTVYIVFKSGVRHRETWNALRAMMMPIFMHTLFFLLPLPLCVRIGYHWCMNLSVLIDRLFDQKFDDVIAASIGTVTSKFMPSYDDITLDELVDLYNKAILSGNVSKACEFENMIGNFDHAQVFGYFQNMVTSMTGSFGLNPETRGAVEALTSQISQMRNVTITHNVDLGVTIPKAAETMAWVVFTYQLTQVLTLRQYNDDPLYKSAYANLIVTSFVLGVLKMDDIQKLYQKVLGITPQTTGSTALDILIDGAGIFLFGKAMSLAPHSSLVDLTTSFTKLSSFASSATTFSYKVITWVQQLAIYVCNCFGLEIKTQNTIYSSELDTFNSFAEYVEKELVHSLQVRHVDVETIRKTITKLNSMYNDSEKAKVSVFTRQQIQVMIGRYKVLLARSEVVCADKGSRTSAPFCLGLCGPPGNGKSELTKFFSNLFVNLTVAPYNRADFEKNPANYAAYTKSAADKFTSGYHNGIKVVVMSDFLQLTDKPGDPVSEANQFIHLISSETMPANMADLESKGRVWMAPEVVVFDTNNVGQHVDIKSIISIAAMHRRMEENALFVGTVPGFRTENPTYDVKMAHVCNDDAGFDYYTSKMDLSKSGVYEGDPTDLWRFQWWSFSCQKPLSEFMDFKQVVAEVLERFNKHKDRTSNLTKKFNAVFDGYYKAAYESAKPVDPQTWTVEAFKSAVQDYLVSPASVCLKRLGSAFDSGNTDELTGSEVDLVKTLDDFKSRPASTVFGPYFGIISLMLKDTVFRRWLEKAYDSYDAAMLEASALSQVDGSVLLAWWDVALLEFTAHIVAYQRALSSAASKVADSYWAIESIMSRFCFPLLTYKNGAISLGVISMAIATWAYLSGAEKGVPQSTSNISQADLYSNRILRNQLYMQFRVTPSDPHDVRVFTFELNSVLMIKDTTALTVGHCWDQPAYYHSQGYRVDILLFTFSNVSREKADYVIPYSDIRVEDTRVPDIVAVNFGIAMGKCKDIYPELPHRYQSDILLDSNYQYRITRVHEGNHVTIGGITKTSKLEYVVGKAIVDAYSKDEVIFRPSGRQPSTVIRHEKVVLTSLNMTGACGTLGFVTVADHSLRRDNPKYNQPVPCMMHVAGSTLGRDGYSVFIYKELLDGISWWTGSTRPFVSRYDDVNGHFQSIRAMAAVHGFSKDVAPMPRTRDVDFDMHRLGQDIVAEIPKSAPPNRSVIVKSPFHGIVTDIFPIEEEFRTANLSYARDDEGVHRTVVDLNSVKYGQNPGGRVSADQERIVGQYFDNELLKNIEGVGDKRMTFCLEPVDIDAAYEGVIQGRVDPNGFRYKCLPRDRASGFTIKNFTSIKGRSEIFGEGMFPSLGSPEEKFLRDLVKTMHAALVNGEDISVFFEAQPKDELRPKSKVVAAKTRLFSSGDLAYLILNMIYFSDIIAICKYRRHDIGFMPGTNPYNTDEWSAWAARLTSKGSDIACKDLSAFDSSVSSLNIEAFSTFVTRFYSMMNSMQSDPDRFEVDVRVRTAMLGKLADYNMIYDMGGVANVVHFDRALCSGSYLTSLMGTYVNMRTHFCSLVSITLNKKIGRRLSINEASRVQIFDACAYVDKHCATMAYGDDSATSTNLPHVYTVDAMCEELELLYGLKATNECEGDKELSIYGYVPLRCATIIARKFATVPGVSGFVAPLRNSSLVKQLEWDKKDMPLNVRRVKIDNFLREVALHGPEVHAVVVRRINPVIRDELEYRSLYEDWHLAIASVLSDTYTPEWDEGIEVEAQSFSGLPSVRFASHRVSAQRPGGTGRGLISRGVCLMLPLLVHSISIVNVMESYAETVKVSACVDQDLSIYCAQSSSSSAMESTLGARVSNVSAEPVVICDEEGPTCFSAATEVVKKDVNGGTVTEVRQYAETIAAKMSRPQYLGEFAWSNAAAINSDIFTIPSISEYLRTGGLLLQPYWAETLKGYKFFKGTFNIRVELNASAFMAGSLLMSHIPNNSNRVRLSATTFNQLVQKFQLPHLVMTTSQTTAEFSIPFSGPNGWHIINTTYASASDAAAINIDWGSFTVTVLTPLRVGPNAINNDCGLSVYGYWTDVETAAPSMPQSSNLRAYGSSLSKKRAGGRILAKGEVSRPISDTLSSISVASNALSAIPVIGSMMSSLSWASRVASGAASAFGYSKPLLNVEPHVVVTAPLRYLANADGPEAAIPTATFQDNSTKAIADLARDGKDDMALSYLCQEVTHYVAQHTWTTSGASDAVIFTRLITPSNFFGHIDRSNTVPKYVIQYGGPMFYLGNVFAYWRGSIRLSLKIIKTSIHTGRLMVVFTPAGASPAAVGLTNTTNSMRAIVDIREQDTIDFVLPFMMATDYLPVRPLSQSEILDSFSGTLTVLIMNELRASETVSSTVDIIETYTAGPDFEFQVPTRGQYLTEPDTAAGYQYITNSDYTAVPVIPQSSSTPAAMAVIGDQTVEPAVIGPSERCIGENIASVKQLIMRQSTNCLASTTSNRYTIVDPTVVFSYRYRPVDQFTPATPADPTSPNKMFGDMYAYVAMMYLYYRGTTIVDVHAPTSDTYATLNMGALSNNNLNFSSALLGQAVLDNLSGAPAAVANAGAWGPKPQAGGVSVMSVGSALAANRFDGRYQSWTVPYYNVARCSFVPIKTASASSVVDRWRNRAMLQISSATYTAPTIAVTRLSRRAADDFQFTCFLACPPLLTYL